MFDPGAWLIAVTVSCFVQGLNEMNWKKKTHEIVGDVVWWSVIVCCVAVPLAWELVHHELTR